MVGNLPGTRAFDREIDRGWGYAQDGYTTVTTEVEGDFGWAMLIVNAEDGGFADVIGCSDTFDAPADEAEVAVENVVVDGEEMVELTIDASFGAEEVNAVVLLPDNG